jgi:hypothetical protein
MKIRHQEFEKFVLEGTVQHFGSLSMSGDEVYSYQLRIARIDRTKKVVIAQKVTGVSRTTTVHINAIVLSRANLKDYTFIWVSHVTPDMSVQDAMHAAWGHLAHEKDLKSIVRIQELAWKLAPSKKGEDPSVKERVQEWLAASDTTRQAMEAIWLMALDAKS